ncbi:heat shock protein 105 kDa-like [Argiope bruennichi]|uniref:Heat shock protein 105 kDa like protein n=1 Tax=Argiope bruennichi TaxID=94029 RepID=A0A8T0F466_ARGBR|nr:heat shock protein 105 kDa-like [Argiope bruennichi]KAF8785641.1 Heat shock protein 105 kDa like protein [Argiope bruennichi]
MSVIGIDIGNENCYIAVARAGGIETIANEYSQRSTPTYVAFGEKTRDLGVTAKNKQITNLKNTIFSFKRLIGRKYKDPVIQQELQYVPFQTCELPNGEVGLQVNYLQEQHVFTVPQVMAMMFTKLKEISESNLKIKVQDCVVSVPVYYTDVERRAILDSAEIAGLNVLRLMNEPTAVALAYGFYKQDLPEDKPKNVVFVDLGNSSIQATACAFTKGKLKILGSAWNRNLGGRDFDNTLVRHFVEDFNQRYKLDILSNRRAVIRLLQECEKLKKQMSANSLELPINIECFMEDKDVSGRMKRETFEKLSANLLQLIEYTLVKLLRDTGLKTEDIDSVQVVGGSSRIPAFKSLIQKVFGKEPSTTLNQDEAVARGCALQCAMLSPTFKVRDFSITDIQPYPIKIVYKAVKTEEESETEIFPAFHAVPYTRLLTFFRTEPFTLDVLYSDKTGSVGVPKIGTFTVMNVTPTPEGESSKVKVKARINIHGIFSISSATMVEKVTAAPNEQENAQTSEISNSVPENKKSEDAMESDNAGPPNGDISSEEMNDGKSSEKQDNDKKEPEQKKSKNQVKYIDLPIKSEVPSLTKDTLNLLIEKESKMIQQDKMEKEKADAKNAVEEYVYEFRGKLGEELEKFVTDQERDDIRQYLDETENWLYDEGEDQQKSVYVERLNKLKKHGDPVMFRYSEWEQRPGAMNALGSSLQMVHKALQSYETKEETYAHIEKEDMMKVKSIWEQKEQWYGQYLHSLANLQPYQNPPVTVSQIMKEREDLERQVYPILNKPKPKVEPPPEDKNVNGQPQTDSEMQDTNNTSEKADKPAQQSGEKGSNAGHSENMETN